MFSISGLFLRRFVGETPAAWLALLAVLSTAITAYAVRSERPQPAALLPLVALTVTGGIATVFGIDPLTGVIYLALWGSMVLIWWQATLMPTRIMERATFAVLAAFALMGLYEVLLWALLYGAGRGGVLLRPMVSFPSPNHLGAALIAGMALALKQKRWGWLALAAITLALTGSRGAMIGVMAGAAVYAIWRFVGAGADVVHPTRPALNVGETRKGGSQTRPYKILLIGGAAVLLIGITLFVIQLSDATHAPANFRVDLWQAAIRTFAEHPITGIGLENYKFGFLEHAELTHERIHEQAHSVPLQIAAEQGVIGLAALILLVITSIRALLSLHRSGDRDRLVVASAFFAAMAVQGIFDHVYEAVINALVVMLTAWAIMRGSAPLSPAQRVGEGLGVRGIAAAVVVIFIAAWGMASITPVWPHVLMPFAAGILYLTLRERSLT